MIKFFLMFIALLNLLNAATECLEVTGCRDQAAFSRFNFPNGIPGAFELDWKNAPIFVASLPRDVQDFFAPLKPIDCTSDFSKACSESLPKLTGAGDESKVREVRSAMFILLDSVRSYDQKIYLCGGGDGLEKKVDLTIRALFKPIQEQIIKIAGEEFISSVSDKMLGLMAARAEDDEKLSSPATDELLKSKLVQVITQAYFKTTGEDYVETLLFVKGSEDELMDLAVRSGFVRVQQSLADYRKYRHLASVFAGKNTLVLGCGQLSLGVNIYQNPFYAAINHVFVSSCHSCNHEGHVTIARTPGNMPDVVADVFEPEFFKALSSLGSVFTKIIDEERGLINAANQAAFEALLAPGGIIIGMDWDSVREIFRKP